MQNRYEIFDITTLRYERKGECIKCGKCCLGEGCEHLCNKTCSIFGSSERPAKCLLFPAFPPIVFKGCGYYFIDKWDNNKIIKDMVT